MRPSVFELRNVVARRLLQERERVRAFDQDLAHVRHVEEPRIRAHGLVLVDDARELDGQLPAAEIDHLSAQLVFDCVQWGFFEGFVRHGAVKLTWMKG